MLKQTANTDIEQLKQDFGLYDFDYLVSKWVIERLPSVFEGDYESYIKTKIKLSKLLGVDSCSIIFVGSSSTGFSLSPHKQFKIFDKDSDIDIAVISHYLFDVAWHTIRNIDPNTQTADTNISLKDHRTRLIYWGTIATDRILGLLPFGQKWLKAINEIKKDGFFEDRDISFRLYRDHESLRAYHINNFKSNLPGLSGVESQSITLI